MKKNHLILLRNLLFFLLIILIFDISLVENSIPYRLQSKNNQLTLEILNTKIPLQTNNEAGRITISVNPQQRYSTAQYLIADKGLIQNSQQILKLLLLRKKSPEIILTLPLKSSVNLIHFNPFRSSLNIDYSDRYYRLEVNIPDASLEVWDNQKQEKLQSYEVNPPWLRLTLFPILTSLMVATFLYYFLSLIGRGEIARVSTNQKLSGDFGYSTFDKVFSLIVFILGAVIISLVFFKVYSSMPGFGDEMNYLFQAKIFAAGKFSIRQPSLPEFFKVDWMDIFGTDKKLWNFHPPGNSLILILGQLIGIEWITIPIIAGLILVVQYFLALSLFESQPLAIIYLIVILTSHYFISLAGTYMAHAPSLLFISLFLLFLVKYFKERRGRMLLFASVTLGFAFVIRPISAVLASIIPLVFLLFFITRRFLLSGSRAKKTLAFYLFGSLLIGLLISSFVFLYSYKVSGKWTLPYLVKGPEADQTLPVRWSKGWDFRLKNLYRNASEFQNRSHSLGYIFNYVFFLIPLFALLKNKKRLFILAGYLSFATYLILHSFLHWYGWLWEPRMIYDISFIFFLITAYGLWLSYQFVKAGRLLKYPFILVFFSSILFIAIFNLSYRFRTEYKDYNKYPTGVKESIKKKKISRAVIFFTDDKVFAPYFTQNTLFFDGSIIYALSQNEDYDYKLITRFPNYDVFYSLEGKMLQEKPNFYKKDLSHLERNLATKYMASNIITVIPWLKFIPGSIHNNLPGKKVNIDEFVNLMISDKIADGSIVLLLDQSLDLKRLISKFYENTSIASTNFESPLEYILIVRKNPGLPDRVPLFKMICYQGIEWDGDILKKLLVTNINVGDCLGQDRSITWSSYFDLEESKKIGFYLDSDDASEILIDDSLVLQANQNGVQTAEIDLETGDHSFTIKFNNGPNGEFLHVGTISNADVKTRLSSDSKEIPFYLPRQLWN